MFIRLMLTLVYTVSHYFYNDIIKEMMCKVSVVVYLVHQENQNLKSGSSHLGANVKHICNGVIDDASGVVVM